MMLSSKNVPVTVAFEGKNFNATSPEELGKFVQERKQKGDLLTTVDQKDLVSSYGILSTESNFPLTKRKYSHGEGYRRGIMAVDEGISPPKLKGERKQALISQMDFNFGSIPKELTPAM